MALKKSHIAFCENYIKFGYNGAEAYRKAYPKCKEDVARINAYQLLTNPYIKQYIDELAQKQREKYDLDNQKLIKMLEEIIYLDPTEAFEFGEIKITRGIGDNKYTVSQPGNVLKNLKDLPVTIRRWIKKFKFRPELGDHGEFEVEFISKEFAMKLLGLERGMFVEKVNHNISGSLGLDIKLSK